MKILIAEDDFTSRISLAAILNKCGHAVLATKNGLEAWDAMQRADAPRIAVLDWVMPAMSGIEVCRRIRTLNSDAPPYIIMLTSKGEKDNVIAGLDAGADDYLAKPFDAGELRARIEVGRRLVEMQDLLLKVRYELEREASHDPLTGALNRRAIMEALSREGSRDRRHHTGVTIAICDIDHFKRINDTYGHMVGDEVLCGLVHILESRLRSYDYLGRWGGEEFVLILPDIKGKDGSEFYERFRMAVAETPIPTRAGNIPITISLGVKRWQADESVDDLLSAADAALYRAKNEGRNRVCLADEPCVEAISAGATGELS